MTFAAPLAVFRHPIAPSRPAAKIKAAPRRGFLARLFDALVESRERSAGRDIEAYLARTGGRFTDSIEREINERHFNGGWNPRR